MNGDVAAKPLHWVSSSKRDIKAMPADVRRTFGFALWRAQRGGRHRRAKVLKGFGGSSVLEVVEDHQGNTYRAVYTVRFARVVFVLHVFQKKSTKGIKTAKHIIDVIRGRMSMAEKMYEEWCAKQDAKKED